MEMFPGKQNISQTKKKQGTQRIFVVLVFSEVGDSEVTEQLPIQHVETIDNGVLQDCLTPCSQWD